ARPLQPLPDARGAAAGREGHDPRAGLGRDRLRPRGRPAPGRHPPQPAPRGPGPDRAQPSARPTTPPPVARRAAAAAPEGVIGTIRATLRVAWRAFLRFQDHHGPDRAAAVAYDTLLSLVPLLIFLVSLGVMVLGSFDAAYQGSMLLVRGVVIHLSPASLDALRTLGEQASPLHWPGLLLLAWTSRRIFASLFSALETVFGVPGRSFAKHNLVALAMVMLTGMALMFTRS